MRRCSVYTASRETRWGATTRRNRDDRRTACRGAGPGWMPLPKAQRPTVQRGDIASGSESSESVLREAAARAQPYLTKLRLTKHVKALIKTLFRANHWEETGYGWDGGTDRLMLSGWSRARRVVVLRRPLTARCS